MSEDRPRGAAITVLAAAALALLLYAGAYVALVERGFDGYSSLGSVPSAPPPEYRAGGRFARAFFTPAHALDRRLRRDYWSAKDLDCVIDEFYRRQAPK
jgi:hypothetical protein